MTATRVGFVDVYVYRGQGEAFQCLLLRRGAGRSRPGSWEAVHGRIEPGETPVAAAWRELHEETGCRALRLYNLSRVEQIYLHRTDELIQVPMFAAELPATAAVQLSAEHDAFEWLPPTAARRRCSWPRAARALDDLEALFGAGGAGALEDVLRVPPPGSTA
jgi:8-oxo-dGTP pyrophosphatase MutT (NUDIX family)